MYDVIDRAVDGKTTVEKFPLFSEAKERVRQIVAGEEWGGDTMITKYTVGFGEGDLLYAVYTDASKGGKAMECVAGPGVRGTGVYLGTVRGQKK